MRIELTDTALRFANTGAPPDRDGVEGMSTLRASTKRDAHTIGRFGVGFAAVLALSDEPRLLTHAGAVEWSRRRAAALAATIPGLQDELGRRADAGPVLRLPWAVHPAAAARAPADGYDTEIVLPFRDDAAAALARDLVAALDDALPLALPGLTELIVVGGPRPIRRSVQWQSASEDANGNETGNGNISGQRVIVTETHGTDDSAEVTRTWRLAQRNGVAAEEWMADRPLEERDRARWSVTAAICEETLDGTVSSGSVLHAPTPTDDPHGLPALLIGTFPLDSGRRRVQPGALTDVIVHELATAYAEVVAGLARSGVPALQVAAMIPSAWGSSELDTALRGHALTALGRLPFVGAAGNRLRPRDVVRVPGLGSAADGRVLASTLPGLPDPEWWGVEALDRLGARVIPLSDVVDELAGLALSPGDWRDLYAGLNGAEPEALMTIGVPLIDGRTVRGARSVFLPDAVDASTLQAFGLRVVHPDAVHPLLRRLGATEAEPAAVLRHPTVRAEVSELAEHPDPDRAGPIVDAVLALVATSGLNREDEPWLAELPVPDGAGETAPAGELWLPDAPLLELLDVDLESYVIDDALLEHHGRAALTAIGVRSGFGVVQDADVVLDEDSWHDLDDEESWARQVRRELGEPDLPPVAGELLAVRDLDLVRDDTWPQTLALLAADPQARAAVTQPLLVLAEDGSRQAVTPYTAWWLRRHAQVAGARLAQLCVPSAPELVRALLQAVDLPVDDAFAAALGLARGLGDIDSDTLLERLADTDLVLSSTGLAEVIAELLRRAEDGVPHPCAPERVRVPVGADTIVVSADDVVVVDGPHWLPILADSGGRHPLPAPALLADVLDVDLASELGDARPDQPGSRRPVPAEVAAVLLGAPESYLEHDDLVVAGTTVDWWVDDDGVHAATTHGLSRGLAWAAGRWQDRWVVAAVLDDPAALPELRAEQSFDAPVPLGSADAEQ